LTIKNSANIRVIYKGVLASVELYASPKGIGLQAIWVYSSEAKIGTAYLSLTANIEKQQAGK
jgi:hypothetical protein